MQKMMENQRICRSWRIFPKNSRHLNAQDQQGTHEQLSQNRKTVVDHPGNETVLRFMFARLQTFERGHFYKLCNFFVSWRIYKHIVCEIAYSGQY